MHKLTLIMVCISLLLTGCWDYQEVDRQASVLAMGLDRIPGSNIIFLTVQIASPEGKGGSKQTGAGQEGGGGVYTVMNSEGKSLSLIWASVFLEKTSCSTASPSWESI